MNKVVVVLLSTFLFITPSYANGKGANFIYTKGKVAFEKGNCLKAMNLFQEFLLFEIKEKKKEESAKIAIEYCREKQKLNILHVIKSEMRSPDDVEPRLNRRLDQLIIKMKQLGLNP
ncbi:MAG: hypothetical protein HWE30_13895 [Methylocystaceae bacterium]|nr:hypothetical protein [Methylocystaceae bacterium]